MAFQLIGVLVALAVSYFVHQDAKARGMNAILWAILVFLILIIALPVYLIIRKPKIA